MLLQRDKSPGTTATPAKSAFGEANEPFSPNNLKNKKLENLHENIFCVIFVKEKHLLCHLNNAPLNLWMKAMYTTILSRLRKLDAQTILNISTMPITIDINQDYLYKKGREEGREEGLEKGREEGLEEGLEKGREEEYKLIYMKMHAAGFTALEISTLLDRNLADVTAVIAAGTASTQSESEQGPAVS